jgi:hypothetical protein
MANAFDSLKPHVDAGKLHSRDTTFAYSDANGRLYRGGWDEGEE